MSQQIGGHFASGRLFLVRRGIKLHETVSVRAVWAAASMTNVFAPAVTMTIYCIDINKRRVPAGTAPGAISQGQWAAGLEFDLGYDYKPGDALPAPGFLTQRDYSQHVAKGVSGDDLPQITVWGARRRSHQTGRYWGVLSLISSIGRAGTPTTVWPSATSLRLVTTALAPTTASRPTVTGATRMAPDGDHRLGHRSLGSTACGRRRNWP